MAKQKEQEDIQRKAHKKSKKKKSSKSSKGSPSPAATTTNHVEQPVKSAAETLAEKSKLNQKQTELARIYHLKCDLLLRGDLSYLEYQELREEICRLNVLKETLASQLKI